MSENGDDGPLRKKIIIYALLVCRKCGGMMKGIAFLTAYAMADEIIDHLKLTFVAERPPPEHLAHQEVLIAAESGGEYFS